MQTDQDLYNELSYYTLSHRDPSFIHQHIVDVYTAQTADAHTKPIAITFALAGLYLYLEKHFTGKQVQQMHMKMAKKKREWLKSDLPKERGEITVKDVLFVQPGSSRDEMIRKWCVSVWQAYKSSHGKVADTIFEYLE